MSKRLTQRKTLIVLLFLIGLFVLAVVLLSRLLPASSRAVTGAATGVGTTASAQAGVGSTTAAQADVGTTTPDQTAQALAAPAPTLDPATASRCRDQVKGFIGQLDPLVSAWVDARKTAGRAAPADLGAQVAKLQAVRQQVQAMSVPVCAETPYLSLLDSMDHTIEAYRGFVAELPEDGIRAQLEQANQSFTRYVGEIDQLR